MIIPLITVCVCALYVLIFCMGRIIDIAAGRK